jgi:hypothetical protein
VKLLDDELTPLTYHAYTGAVSNSGLQLFEHSRLAYHEQYVLETSEREPPSRAMELGTVLHSLLRCPVDVACPTDLESMRGLVRKWESLREALESLTAPLDSEEMQRVLGMRQALLNHATARRLLWELPGETERIIVWYDPIGVRRKAMLDRIIPTPGIIADLKTLTVRPKETLRKAMLRNAYDFGYFRQLAYYEDAAQQVEARSWSCVIVAVESSQPHRVGAYDCTGSEWGVTRHAKARAANNQSLLELAECIRSGDWREPEEREIVLL